MKRLIALNLQSASYRANNVQPPRKHCYQCGHTATIAVNLLSTLVKWAHTFTGLTSIQPARSLATMPFRSIERKLFSPYYAIHRPLAGKNWNLIFHCSWLIHLLFSLSLLFSCSTQRLVVKQDNRFGRAHSHDFASSSRGKLFEFQRSILRFLPWTSRCLYWTDFRCKNIL